METNVILKYRRESDYWLCPECDTENNMSLGKCTVCGCRKSPSATILKHWTEADDRPVTPPKKTPMYTPSGPVFKDTEKDGYIPEEENNNAAIWLFIILIIIIGFIVVLTQTNTYATNIKAKDVMVGCNCRTVIYDELQQETINTSFAVNEQEILEDNYGKSNNRNSEEFNKMFKKQGII